MNKYLLGTCALNEGQKIRQVIARFNDYSVYDCLIIDDGSDDGSLDNLPSPEHIVVIKNTTNKGAGHGVRQILKYAQEKGYVAVFFVSGNNKDDPQDVYKLQKGIEEGFDFVQGSRYLPGGQFGGDIPLYRKMATRLYPFIFSVLTGRKITDSTNGFRAVRISMLEDRRINLDQPWLERYEMEPYLFYKAVTLGYKVKEVPVRKIYPKRKHGYTKMRPFSGWWSILRPIIFLSLRIKK
ncbi:MAG TPA: glycosyltransferase family 2 protein [Candidatus Omnitrophota bacterium]|nr:glycosyltransferase family 2 protein [Candidatus Omnitrophota bacterium]